jgi:hypothetical protein
VLIFSHYIDSGHGSKFGTARGSSGVTVGWFIAYASEVSPGCHGCCIPVGRDAAEASFAEHQAVLPSLSHVLSAVPAPQARSSMRRSRAWRRTRRCQRLLAPPGRAGTCSVLPFRQRRTSLPRATPPRTRWLCRMTDPSARRLMLTAAAAASRRAPSPGSRGVGVTAWATGVRRRGAQRR